MFVLPGETDRGREEHGDDAVSARLGLLRSVPRDVNRGDCVLLIVEPAAGAVGGDPIKIEDAFRTAAGSPAARKPGTATGDIETRWLINANGLRLW